jgi:hypothetical protein
MTIYGFTAGREILYPEAIYEALKTIVGDEHTYITGGARGGDSLIGQWLWENVPAAKHIILLPTKKNELDQWWEGKKGVFPIKPNNLTSYRDRNRAIVSRAEELYAFPAYYEDHPQSQRSGTWQTVRMGRRKRLGAKTHIPVHIFVQGGDSWTETEFNG